MKFTSASIEKDPTLLREIIDYDLRGDFAYFEGGRKVVEDFKGVMTPAFRLKRKLFKALHPDIELRVTNRKGETVNVRTRKASRIAA